MNKKYIVTANVLNLRLQPNGTVIGAVSKNEIVEFIESNGLWFKVKTSKNIVAWMHSNFLAEHKEVNASNQLRFGIDKVHLFGNAERKNVANASSLSEKLPKTKNIFEILSFLDVENPNHKRYAPRKDTFCNIYAHDFAYCLGVYLPRVFWGGNFIKGSLVTPKYGVNLFEQNANMITDWIKNEGKAFGWQLAVNELELQNKVNEGNYFGVISAKDVGGIGHITVVLPTLNVTDYPLQSQAGRYNQYLFKSDWYKHRKFDSVVFGYCQF